MRNRRNTRIVVKAKKAKIRKKMEKSAVVLGLKY